MKFLTGLIFGILLIIYGFAVHMTSVEPDKVIWGYICTIIFGVVFTWGVAIISKHQGKNKDSENKDSNL
jgi:DMSO reductase anchor subunit